MWSASCGWALLAPRCCRNIRTAAVQRPVFGSVLHMLMGPLGGLCLGFCVDYRYKTAMNCFGALMLGTGIYGLHGAVLLRIVDTVLGVTFALVFSAIFHRLAAVRLLPDTQENQG